MAHSSARATLGGSDVRKTTRQTRKKAPTPVTVNAVTGGAGVRRVTRQTSGATTTPASSSAAGSSTRRAPGTRAASRRAQSEQRRVRRLKRIVRKAIAKDPEVSPSIAKALSEGVERKTDKLWQEAKRTTGLTGKPPEIQIAADNKAPWGGKRVKLTSTAAAAIMGAVPRKERIEGAKVSRAERRVAGKHLFLHEAAHVGQQRAGLTKKGYEGKRQRRTEGRAERFANMQLAKQKIGIRKLRQKVKASRRTGTTKGSHSVGLYAKRSRRQDTKRDILYGQFKDTGEPKDKQPSKKQKQRVRVKLKEAAKKSEGGLAKKLDRPFGPNETITPRQTAIVAESEGLPGITYAKAIAPGESGHKPGIPNPDDATPSLFQITPSVQSAATRAKFDRIAAKHPGGYSNPIVAGKQAAVLAKGTSDAGVSNYVAFNASAPQGHLPGGPKAARRKLYGDPKPIPKPLKQKAKKVFGPQKTKKVIERAKTPPSTSTAPKKQKGVYAGSRAIVKELIGPEVAKTQDWQDKEDRGDPGGTMHDIGTMDAFAADLPVSEKTVDIIARKLGLDPKKVNYGTTGLESGIIYKGYDIEFLPYTHGGGPHIHIGAKWVGDSLPAGTTLGGGSLGGVTTGGATATSTGTGATVTATSPMTAKQRARRRAKRMDGRAKSKLIRELIANEPAPIYQVDAPSTTPAQQPVTLGIT